jgi:signal transduction histidine kinase
MLLQPPTSRRRLMGALGRLARAPLVLALGGALCLATAGLLWLGYRATAQWDRSEAQLADRRASEKLALLIAALDRDMKGAQLSVLVPINQEQLSGSGSAGLSALFARAFARFPYPESFFVWSRPSPTQETTYVFNRADRPPPWDTLGDRAPRYPVVTRRDRTALAPFIDQIRRDATHRKRFAAYELDIAGVPYQVVVHLLYDDITGGGRLFGLVGYTVNLPWAKREYFNELASQVARIGGGGEDMAVRIGERPAAAPHAQRFAIRFFDRNLTQLLPADSEPEQWTAEVTPPSPAEPGALSGRRMFALMGLAAVVSIVSVVVIARGLVVTSELIAMKSEFVSTVTHELKTPLSSMGLVADTLVTGRYRGPEKIPEYGALLSAEVSRMTHLIDNLLSFARLTRVDNFYAPAPLDLAELLEEASGNVRSRLKQLDFTLTIEIGHEPIVLHADRTALLLVIDNLLDNAVKYSAGAATRAITIRGRLAGTVVAIEVQDQGSGIHDEDLPKVTEKFFRGRQARAGGTGLGLAIVTQIVRDHRGRVEIASSLGRGTTVRILLPAG